MQTVVLWLATIMMTLLFITTFLHIVKTPDQREGYILYEKKSYRHRQWTNRFNTAFRWAFATLALGVWCATLGYMGYTHLNS